MPGSGIDYAIASGPDLQIGRKKPNRRMRAFRQLGIEAGIAYSWSRSRMGGWAIAQSPIMGTTVTAERLAKRGYQSFIKYYEQIFHGSRTA